MTPNQDFVGILPIWSGCGRGTIQKGRSSSEERAVAEADAGEERVDPRAADMRLERVERAVSLFRRQQARGRFPGGQLVVRRRGVLVIDEAVGVARGYRPEEGEEPVPYTAKTRGGVFSAGKPLVGIAVAILESRRAVDVTAPVAAYWPEFGRRGKDAVTVLDVLTHRSGLYLREIEGDWQSYGDWAGIISRIEETEPKHPRGTLAYQPMGFGWILGELVRRISGKPIERFLQEDLLGPANIQDLRLGVPVEELPELARSYWVDERPPELGGEGLTGFEELQNSAEYMTSVLPGAGTVGTARGLAQFYDWLLRGTPGPGGDPLVAPEILVRYVTPQVRGRDRTVGIPIVLGRGFSMGWFWPGPYGWWRTGGCYGHPGNFATLAWADPGTGCAIAMVTNGNRRPMSLLTRGAPIGSAVRAACA